MLRLLQIIKDFLISFPLAYIFKPIRYAFIWMYYLIDLNIWLAKHKGTFVLNHGYTFQRDYDRRIEAFQFLVKAHQLDSTPITYLEYGVAAGGSFRWWMEHSRHAQSSFFGFDTFEGLPEDWGGFYKAGDMASDIPQIDDARGSFIKGLFQDTLLPWIHEHRTLLESSHRKVIHMDADLYSATDYVLSLLYPYLRSGDLILFDEFNVPLHEYKAFAEFTSNFYVTLIPQTAVNNYYQASFMVK